MMNKEYLNKIHNIDKNYKKIISKSKEKNNVKKKILNMVAVLIVIILVGTTSTKIYAKRQWAIQFKEYENRQYSFASTAIENGYVENINMEYIYQNEIGVKVDSLVVTDDHFESNISFEFPENMVIDSESFVFGYAVYDEENLYNFNNRFRLDGSKTKFDFNYLKFLYEEMNIDYNKKDVFACQYADSCGITRVSAHDNNITSKIEMESIKGFPKSKKVYIRIFDLGYTMMDKANLVEQAELENIEIEEFDITNKEWTFEIDVSDEMSKAENKELKVNDEIPNIEIKSCTLTETGMVILLKTNDYIDYVCIG